MSMACKVITKNIFQRQLFIVALILLGSDSTSLNPALVLLGVAVVGDVH